jgi:phosphate transport system substrate-binding protein
MDIHQAYRLNYLVLTDVTGKGAWPITGSVFILTYKDQEKPEVAEDILKFFDWVYSADGDKLAASRDYVSPPPSVVKQIEAAWNAQIKDASGKPL